jgi:hypothetical protein
MLFRNSENKALDRVRAEMRGRLTPVKVPAEVESFLLQHWARLLCDIYLARGEENADWQAGWDTVDALLWSLTPKTNRQDTERLLRVLPVLLGRLQEGCAALGLSEAASSALFEQLVALHAAQAKAGLHAREDAPEGGAPAPKDASDRGLATSGEGAGNGVLQREDADVPDAILDKLQPGDWVTFHGEDGDKHLRLQWISATGSMYLFADAHGLDTLSLTRQRLLERLARGGLTPG